MVGNLARRETDRVRVERSRQAAVCRDQDDQALDLGALAQQRMILAGQHRSQVGQHLVDALAVRARSERRVLGALELRGRDELERAGDLLDVLDRADPPPDLPLANHGRPPV